MVVVIVLFALKTVSPKLVNQCEYKKGYDQQASR